MNLVLAAAAAVLGEFDLVRGIDLVSLGYIILAFANRAYESEYLAGAFFGHKN